MMFFVDVRTFLFFFLFFFSPSKVEKITYRYLGIYLPYLRIDALFQNLLLSIGNTMQLEGSVWYTKTSNIKHQNYGSSTSTESPPKKQKQNIKINKPTIQGEFILDYPSFGIPRLCTEIAKRAHRACQVLLQAPELRIVVVSWWDTTTTTTSAAKSRSADSRGGGDGEEWRSDVLAPLRMLVDGKEKEKKKKKHSYSKRLRFEVGSVNSAEEFGREEFADALRRVVGERMVEVRNLGK